MPECCIAGVSRLEGATMSGCCETGLAPGTEDAARPECCQAGMAVLNQLPPCCKETVVSGQPSDCCGGMMAALVSANS
jgi:hypothetical protein